MTTTPKQQTNPSTSLVYPVVVVGGGSGSSRFWLDLPVALQQTTKVHTLEVGKSHPPLRKILRGYVPMVGRELLATLEAQGLLPCHLLGATPEGSMAVLEAARLLANNHIHPDEVPGNAVSITMLLSALSRDDKGENAITHLREKLHLFCEKISILKQLLILAPYDVRRALGSLERPILCLASEHNNDASWSSQPRLWELNSHAELIILDEKSRSSVATATRDILHFCSQAEKAGRIP